MKAQLTSTFFTDLSALYMVSRKWFRKSTPPYRARRDEQKSPLAYIDWMHN